MYVPNVSYVSDVCCNVKVDLDVVYICKCFKCFHTYVVSVFHLDVAMFLITSGCFDVSNGYTHVFKFFWCFASVLFECYKNRSDVTHVE